MESNVVQVVEELFVFDKSALPTISPFSEKRLGKAKIAYASHAVPRSEYRTLLTGELTPRSGDLMLARITKIGSHKNIETAESRRVHLFPGDEVILCYGPRYAPDQFEAVLPTDLGACHLVAAGGLAGAVVSSHSSTKSPTVITPLGLIGNANGERLNLSNWKLKHSIPRLPLPPTFVFVGTSMNSGKTTSAAHFIHGLSKAGLKVGAAKVTGTASPRDVGFFQDAGASLVLDFSDAGYSSTAGVKAEELLEVFDLVTQHLAHSGAQVLVLEIADGLYQDETAALLCSQQLRESIDGVIFAAADAMGATAGVDWLRRYGLPVLAVTGLITASPLASREATVRINLPLITLKDLSSADILNQLAISDLVQQDMIVNDEITQAAQ